MVSAHHIALSALRLWISPGLRGHCGEVGCCFPGFSKRIGREISIVSPNFLHSAAGMRRIGEDENAAARQRFAEMLCATGKETAEEKQRRLARECPLRG